MRFQDKRKSTIFSKRLLVRKNKEHIIQKGKKKTIMKKISNKIIVLAVTVAFIIGGTTGIVTTYLLSNKQEKDLEQLNEMLNDNFDQLIQYEVETAESMLLKIDDLNNKNIISDDQKQMLAKELLRNLRYGPEGYFWADTKNGDNVVLLGGDSEGKNRLELKDEKGNFLIKNIIKAGLAGGGYTNYWFSKKGGNKPLPKRSYSKYVAPFNWVIGTGNYIDDIDKVISGIEQENKAYTRNIILSLLGIIILLIIVSTIVAWFMGKRISTPIVKLTRTAGEIARGNLKVEITTHSNDEVGLLADSMRKMSEKLKEIILNISRASQDINGASNQISDSSQSLSQIAQQQASASEEVSASLEEMSSNIFQNAENSGKAQDIAQEATQSMQKMEASGKESIQAIQDIAEKITIINDIAFQTNILALNAAVESSRAGEAGKGFAVVAAEVRKLAERSKNAADEIVQLSKSTYNISEESASIIQALVPEITNTHTLVQEINSASQEQNIGVQQINNALQELNESSQQNAASSEELASSAQQLTAQSKALDELVEFFKL